ncbi:MAG: type II toxin-antitoxin system VapC family toxin [Chloroflexota bacterium]
MSLLLDTHVILWWQAGGDRLSSRAADEIARAEHLLVSPLSCWEITSLERQGRIALDRPALDWIRDLLSLPRMASVSLTAEAAAWAGLLDADQFPGDPIDRLLYATARDHRVPVLSKDERMRAYAARAGDVDVIW